MAIFLRQNYKIRPSRWGSDIDIMYAIRENCEKIYGVNSDAYHLIAPFFWGLPLLDYSGRKNHGTNSGATIYPQDTGLGAWFNGVSSYINYGTSINIASWKELSIIARVNYDASGADEHSVISNWTTLPTDAGFILRLEPSDNTVEAFLLIETNSAIGGSFLDLVLIPNRTHTIKLTYNTTEGLQAYLDGKRSTTSYAGAAGIDVTTSPQLWIGAAPHQASDKLTGYIKEAQIINSWLSPAQVALFCDLPYGLYQPVVPAPKVFYFTPASSAGVLNTTLPIISAEIEGTVEIKSLNATLPVITADLKGGGTLNATLSMITAGLGSSNDGNLDATLPVITTEITGFAGEVGEVSATLPLITVDALGGNGGFLDATLPSMTAEMKSGAQLDVTLPVITAEGQAYTGIIGELNVSLPKIEAEAAGRAEVLGDLDTVLPMITVKMSGTVGKVMSLNATLPMITAELAGYQEVTGDLNVILPMITARLVGTPARFEDCVVLRYEEPNL